MREIVNLTRRLGMPEMANALENAKPIQVASLLTSLSAMLHGYDAGLRAVESNAPGMLQPPFLARTHRESAQLRTLISNWSQQELNRVALESRWPIEVCS